MKIGLLFGSFNPIHIGHIAIANYMSSKTDLEQVWFIVSPHNPLKEKKSLADEKKRLALVKKTIGRNSKIKVSNIEFKLSQPSYTINTLGFLKNKFPKNKFVLIIGSDNLILFHKWKDYKKILSEYKIYVYPRFVPLNKGGNRSERTLGGVNRTPSEGLLNHRNVKIVNAPRIDISSTFIREQMKKGKFVRNFVAG